MQVVWKALLTFVYVARRRLASRPLPPSPIFGRLQVHFGGHVLDVSLDSLERNTPYGVTLEGQRQDGGLDGVVERDRPSDDAVSWRQQ